MSRGDSPPTASTDLQQSRCGQPPQPEFRPGEMACSRLDRPRPSSTSCWPTSVEMTLALSTGVGRPERARSRILIVGQGPPTTGGIPTFVGALMSDAMLASAFDIEYY